VLRQWQWEIIREVYYDQEWKERRDTRLMPGESRTFVARDVPEESARVHFVVEVIPDHFYKGVYAGLLSDRLDRDAKQLIMQAAKQADANDYRLFEESVAL
jgi:hypothetical protein